LSRVSAGSGPAARLISRMADREAAVGTGATTSTRSISWSTRSYS
jgi:hypothetical protein